MKDDDENILTDTWPDNESQFSHMKNEYFYEHRLVPYLEFYFLEAIFSFDSSSFFFFRLRLSSIFLWTTENKSWWFVQRSTETKFDGKHYWYRQPNVVLIHVPFTNFVNDDSSKDLYVQFNHCLLLKKLFIYFLWDK